MIIIIQAAASFESRISSGIFWHDVKVSMACPSQQTLSRSCRSCLCQLFYNCYYGSLLLVARQIILPLLAAALVLLSINRADNLPQLATLQLLLRQPARQIVLPLLAAALVLLSINRVDSPAAVGYSTAAVYQPGRQPAAVGYSAVAATATSKADNLPLLAPLLLLAGLLPSYSPCILLHGRFPLSTVGCWCLAAAPD
jgi:hypothetical protein